MSILVIVGPKCTLAASHAASRWFTISICRRDIPTDGRMPRRYFTLSARRSQTQLDWYCYLYVKQINSFIRLLTMHQWRVVWAGLIRIFTMSGSSSLRFPVLWTTGWTAAVPRIVRTSQESPTATICAAMQSKATLENWKTTTVVTPKNTFAKEHRRKLSSPSNFTAYVL